MCRPLLAAVLLCSSLALTGQALEGLWVVQRVEVNAEVMTPVARWMRFDADGHHTSGNGWRQHTVGTWSWDTVLNELTVTATNGTYDPHGPFSVSGSGDSLVLRRTEEALPVRVVLTPATDLPQAPADALLGLWQEPATGDHLFLRWDQRFVQWTEGERSGGVYQVHGHRNELLLIHTGDSCRMKRQAFTVMPGRMRLGERDWVRTASFPTD